MFYSTFVLQRKGPFAKVWIAAHWDKKLTKADIKLVDISETVVNIVRPTVPIALRTSGELMLGVVRIYSHKVKFLLKEAQDATLKIKALDVIQPAAGRIDMPHAKGAVIAVIEPEHGGEVDDTLPVYENPLLVSDRAFVDAAPPRIGLHLGDLEDWFPVPGDQEHTFEESQQEAFFPSLSQFGRPGREKTPSEVSSVVSSTERLRDRFTPERRGEVDMAVQVPVDELDLFGKMEEPPLPFEEAPLPEQLEVVTPGKAEEPMPEEEIQPEHPAEERAEKVERPKKKVALAIDKQTIIHSAVIKQRLEDTSDIVQQDIQGALDQKAMRMKSWDSSPHADRFAMPVCPADLESRINELWKAYVQPLEAEEAPEAEELRRPEARPSLAPGEAPFQPEMAELPPFEMREEMEVPAPQMEMELPISPEAERKRKAQEEEGEARKRARVGAEAVPDLAKTVHDTLAQLADQFRTSKSVKFGTLVKSQPRSVAATRFYDLLVLKNKNMVNVKQPAPLAEITITPTEHFRENLIQV